MATTRLPYWRSAAAILAALTLTACGTGVKPDSTYQTAADLKAAAVKAGYSCPNWDDRNTAGSFDGAVCLTDHRDQFRVYPNQGAREADLEGNILGVQLGMVAARTEMVLLVGPNWTIAGPKDEVTSLKPSLGGYLPDLSDVRMPS